MNRVIVVSELKRTLRETLAVFGWGAASLSRSYGPGKWTGIQILAHLTHCELVFLTRLHYIVAEENPVVVPFDQNAWMKRYPPKVSDLRSLRQLFQPLRAAFITRVKNAPPSDFSRRARHPENPDYTFEYLVLHAIEHTDNHLAQLRAIKAGTTWTATRSS